MKESKYKQFKLNTYSGEMTDSRYTDRHYTDCLRVICQVVRRVDIYTCGVEDSSIIAGGCANSKICSNVCVVRVILSEGSKII